MKQIKTITRRLSDANVFDADVNFALREGWTLVERKVLQPPAQPNTNQRDAALAELEELRTENEELKRELHALDGRLRHLLQSKTIQLFDEVEHPLRQQYRLDIKILDDCCTLRHCVTCKYKGVDELFPPCSHCSGYTEWEPKEGAETCRK